MRGSVKSLLLVIAVAIGSTSCSGLPATSLRWAEDELRSGLVQAKQVEDHDAATNGYAFHFRRADKDGYAIMSKAEVFQVIHAGVADTWSWELAPNHDRLLRFRFAATIERATGELEVFGPEHLIESDGDTYFGAILKRGDRMTIHVVHERRVRLPYEWSWHPTTGTRKMQHAAVKVTAIDGLGIALGSQRPLQDAMITSERGVSTAELELKGSPVNSEKGTWEEEKERQPAIMLAVTKRGGSDGRASWAEIVKAEAKDVARFIQEHSELPDLSGCGGESECQLETILAEVRNKARVDDWHDLELDRDAVNEGRASAGGWNVLFYDMAREAGLDVSLGVTSEFGYGHMNPLVPHGNTLATYLVRWTRDDGSEVWIDATCQRCSPGEVPSRYAGATGLILSFDGDELNVKGVRVKAEPAPVLVEHQGKISLAEKSIQVETTLRTTPSNWLSRRRSLRSSSSTWFGMLNALSSQASADQLECAQTGDSGVSCEATGTFNLKLRPLRGPSRVAIPLAMFWSTIINRHWIDLEYTGDWVFADDIIETEVYRLPLTEAQSVAELPDDASGTAEGLKWEFSASAESDMVVLRRTLTLRQGRYSPSQSRAMMEELSRFDAVAAYLLVLDEIDPERVVMND